MLNLVSYGFAALSGICFIRGLVVLLHGKG